jgi:sec-independent protein translocase protein TatB
MFDIGFSELILIAVVMLLVVGPERLPRIARTTGLWVGKMRGFMSSVKADIDRELATEELRKALAKQAAVPELEELIDEVSGKPLQAGETSASEKADVPRTAEEQAADIKAESTADDRRQ